MELHHNNAAQSHRRGKKTTFRRFAAFAIVPHSRQRSVVAEIGNYDLEIVDFMLFHEQKTRLPHNQPPKNATYLLYFLPKQQREYLIGDLEEEYYEIYESFGKRRAQFWYYYQVGASFWRPLSGVISGIVRWAINDVIRRYSGL